MIEKIALFLLEWIVAFCVIAGLNFVALHLLKKKANPITSAILTFIFVGIFVFLLAPYLMFFHNPAVIYLPMLLFWLVYNVLKAVKEMEG